MVNLSPYVQLTKMSVLAWTSRLLDSGVLGLNLLFFDVRIFNPYAPSNRCNPYRQHETSKRRQYKERVREVEHGNFSPLVFSTSGGMGASTTVAYKRLAFLLSCKWKSPYCRRVMSWLRCRLGFSLLHSAIMCIRGSRSSSGHPFKGHVPASVDLALGEGRLGAV